MRRGGEGRTRRTMRREREREKERKRERKRGGNGRRRKKYGAVEKPGRLCRARVATEKKSGVNSGEEAEQEEATEQEESTWSATRRGRAGWEGARS